MLHINYPNLETYAIGTNRIATSFMLKAGAAYGATGEMLFLGEITPTMATAINEINSYKMIYSS